MAAIPTLIPFGRTARRLEWRFLPPHLRSAIETRCGSPVVEDRPRTSGHTPGFASVLSCLDGSQHFVKAASVTAQRPVAEALRAEARVLRALPTEVPTPRLSWSIEDDWVVLGLAHRATDATPRRPWRRPDLDAVLDSLEAAADALTPAPPVPGLATFAEEFAGFATAWDEIRRLEPDLARIDEAEALAARHAAVTAGDSLVHTDLRDDHLLLAEDGPVLLTDWTFPARGAAWIDTVLVLIGPRGDGLDVDRLLTERRLTKDLDDEEVDVLLALVAGVLLKQCHQPVPPTAPYLRDLQSWQATVVWDWLGERRGWV